MSKRKPRIPPDAILGYCEPRPDDPLWWLSFCDPGKAPPPEEQRPGRLTRRMQPVTESWTWTLMVTAHECAVELHRDDVHKLTILLTADQVETLMDKPISLSGVLGADE